jgi:hypothetical protein
LNLQEESMLRNLSALSLTFVSTIVLLFACHGDDAGSEARTNISRIGILLTDAPIAAREFSHIYATVHRITLLPADENQDSRGAVLFEGEETVDLLDLVNHAVLFSVADNIPPGDYGKLRLTVGKLELIKPDENGDPQSYFPKLPGNGKIDLNPRGTLRLGTGETLLIQVDIDAEKSIHIVKKGHKDEYNFRPVIFVNRVDVAFPGKLVRRSGTLRDLDADRLTFTLCHPSTANIRLPCIAVSTKNASVFDASGAPATIFDLANQQSVNVVGFVDLPSSGTSTLPRLTAEVIEIGGAEAWTTQRGIVQSAPDDTGFPLKLSDTLTLSLQMQSGTKVFGRNGTRLEPTVIRPGFDAAVDGVPDAAASNALRTSLVVIAKQNAPNHLRGIVQTIDHENQRMVISTDSGDRAIRADADTEIFRIVQTAAGVINTRIRFNEIEPGKSVDLYGRVVDGVLRAHVILILEEESPGPS